MKKKLVITPYQRWAFENVDKDYFIGFDLVDTYEKYIEGVFITNNNYNDMGFEGSDTITLEDLPYFERIEIQKDGDDVEVVNRQLKEKFAYKYNKADSLAEDVFGDNFITHEVIARGYNQGDYQSWLFVFRKPKSKKDLKKLEEIMDNLERLSKVFTASEFTFAAKIIVEKEDETCEKEIDDFEDLCIYNDDSWIDEDNEDFKRTIEEVKKKYGIEEIEIEDIIYG